MTQPTTPPNLMPDEFQALAKDVVDAYDARFGTPAGNYLGPIDSEITALRDALTQLASKPKAYPLPDSLYPGSKDWLVSDYAGRVEWLHSRLEGEKQEVQRLMNDVEQIQASKPNLISHPPHECRTEGEKLAYAFGWWKALEHTRLNSKEGTEQLISLNMDLLMELNARRNAMIGLCKVLDKNVATPALASEHLYSRLHRTLDGFAAADTAIGSTETAKGRQP